MIFLSSSIHHRIVLSELQRMKFLKRDAFVPLKGRLTEKQAKTERARGTRHWICAQMPTVVTAGLDHRQEPETPSGTPP